MAAPQRYVKGPPVVTLPPATVHISPDFALNASQILNTPGSLRTVPTLVDTDLPEVVT